MYFYGYRQHQPHAFVNKLNYKTTKLYKITLPCRLLKDFKYIQRILHNFQFQKL